MSPKVSSLILISLKKEQRVQLLLISVADYEHFNKVVWHACEDYIRTQFTALADELRPWLKETVRQKQALAKWLAAEYLEAGVDRGIRPDTSALKLRMLPDSDPCDRIKELIRLDDDHRVLLELLCDFQGLSLDALLERAFDEYIQLKVLDNPAAFSARLDAAHATTRDDLARSFTRLEGFQM